MRKNILKMIVTSLTMVSFILSIGMVAYANQIENHHIPIESHWLTVTAHTGTWQTGFRARPLGESHLTATNRATATNHMTVSITCQNRGLVSWAGGNILVGQRVSTSFWGSLFGSHRGTVTGTRFDATFHWM